jgi:hypothetical protein
MVDVFSFLLARSLAGSPHLFPVLIETDYSKQ